MSDEVITWECPRCHIVHEWKVDACFCDGTYFGGTVTKYGIVIKDKKTLEEFNYLMFLERCTHTVSTTTNLDTSYVWNKLV